MAWAWRDGKFSLQMAAVNGFDGCPPCPRTPALPNEEPPAERVFLLDPILCLAGVMGSPADARDDRVVRAGRRGAGDRAAEDRTDDRLEAARLADRDLALGV